MQAAVRDLNNEVKNPPRVPGQGSGRGETGRVRIDDNNIVDLHLSDEDLSAVLEMLSIQSQRNIVASKNVQARVTANLYGVTFYEALDAILNVNGYGYIEDGNFIYVYTLEEIDQINKFNKPRVSKAINLNYLSAVDAAEFVKPLLSEGGQIKTNGKMAGFPSLGDMPVGNEEYALSSTLVIYDYEENVAEIETLVKQIDTRPAQVLIEATILQTQLNEANAFGVDFAVVANMNFSEWLPLGGPLFGPSALQLGKAGSNPVPVDGGGTAINSTVGGSQGPGGMKVGIVSNDVAVFLRVLDEVTDSTVLSNPKLLCLNRQAARVLVGRKVGYLSTTSTDTATTQTVEFLDTGTQLFVRPIVAPDGMIRMEIKPQVSEAVIRDVKDATGAAVTIPDEITNELSTNVLVRDGQTIVLGGLFRENTVSTRRQVPGIGDLPLIGAAFRGTEDRTERTEIIFLITPTIVNDTALAEAGRKGMDFAADARAGARAGTLIFSRDRLTSQLNIEAEKLAAEGKNEEALQKIDRSLRLNPVQPDIIGLRQRLTGKRTTPYEWSILNRIIRVEAGKSRPSADASWDGQGTPAWVGDGATESTTDARVDATVHEGAGPTGGDFVMTPDTNDAQPTASNSSTDTTQATNAAGHEALPTADTNGEKVTWLETAPATTGDQTDETVTVSTPMTDGSGVETTRIDTAPGNTGLDGLAAAEVTAVTPPFHPDHTPLNFAQLWLSPKGFFGSFWGTTGGAPTVTHVPETTPAAGQ